VVDYNFGQNGSFNGTKTAQGNSDANGIGDFYYSVPTGFLALCTANLPEPTIGPNSDIKTDEVFAPILYTGNASVRSIDVGFQPDFTWIKNRDAADNHTLFDSVRGATKYISSNSTNAEATDANSLTAFDSIGFDLGTSSITNGNTEDYVAWNWKAGGASVTNNDGTLTAEVSAYPEAGISIVTAGYGNGTFGHGLGVTPDVMIWKERSPNVNNCFVQHKDLTSTNYYLHLNDTSAEINAGSDVFQRNATTCGNDNGLTGRTGVAYLFAEVEGFSSFGSYTGNGSTDGPFIYTGFRPAFVMVKSLNASYSWYMHDTQRSPYNFSDLELTANSSGAEYSVSGAGAGQRFDILSNGFKNRTSNIAANQSGITYIYMAFAENPFKYSNAR
jgi:hypothetical protein